MAREDDVGREAREGGLAGGAGLGVAQRGVVDEDEKPVREGVGVAGRKQEAAGFLGDDLRNATDPAGDDRQTGAECFDVDEAGGLGPNRGAERAVGRLEKRLDMPLYAQPANPVADAEGVGERVQGADSGPSPMIQRRADFGSFGHARRATSTPLSPIKYATINATNESPTPSSSRMRRRAVGAGANRFVLTKWVPSQRRGQIPSIESRFSRNLLTQTTAVYRPARNRLKALFQPEAGTGGGASRGARCDRCKHEANAASRPRVPRDKGSATVRGSSSG